MSSKITRVVLLMAVSMVMVSGCKTVGIQVPRLVPARKANLGVFKTVAVQEFDGRAEGSAGVASEMSDSVRQSLSTYERLKVLDRSRLGEVLNELKLGASDLTDGSNVSKLGKIITAGALVAGKITTYMYNEENTRKETTCSRSVKVGKKWRTERYRCTVFERTGKAVVRASIDVIDVTTGATVVTDSLNAERSAYETATDQDPAPIDGRFVPGHHDVVQLGRAAEGIVAQEVDRAAVFSCDVPDDRYVGEHGRRVVDEDAPTVQRGIVVDHRNVGQRGAGLEDVHRSTELGDRVPFEDHVAQRCVGIVEV